MGAEMAVWAPAVAAVLAATVTGWLTVRAKRVANDNPESIAGGYSRLVEDLRQSQERLERRVQELENDKVIAKARIIELERMLRWMMDRLSPVDQADFHREFDAGST